MYHSYGIDMVYVNILRCLRSSAVRTAIRPKVEWSVIIYYVTSSVQVRT
jgi:hypothetical protein